MKKMLPLALGFLLPLFSPAQIDSALFQAILANDSAAVATALQRPGVDVNATDDNGATPMLWACWKAELPVVKALWRAGAKARCEGVVFIEQDSSYYGSPLCAAAGEGELEIVEFLIDSCGVGVDEREYDWETRGYDGWAAVNCGAFNLEWAVLEYLVGQKNCSINVPDKYGRTPLQLIFLKGAESTYFEIFISSYLLGHGANWWWTEDEILSLTNEIGTGSLFFYKYDCELNFPDDDFIFKRLESRLINQLLANPKAGLEIHNTIRRIGDATRGSSGEEKIKKYEASILCRDKNRFFIPIPHDFSFLIDEYLEIEDFFNAITVFKEFEKEFGRRSFDEEYWLHLEAIKIIDAIKQKNTTSQSEVNVLKSTLGWNLDLYSRPNLNRFYLMLEYARFSIQEGAFDSVALALKGCWDYLKWIEENLEIEVEDINHLKLELNYMIGDCFYDFNHYDEAQKCFDDAVLIIKNACENNCDTFPKPVFCFQYGIILREILFQNLILYIEKKDVRLSDLLHLVRYALQNNEIEYERVWSMKARSSNIYNIQGVQEDDKWRADNMSTFQLLYFVSILANLRWPNNAELMDTGFNLLLSNKNSGFHSEFSFRKLFCQEKGANYASFLKAYYAIIEKTVFNTNSSFEEIATKTNSARDSLIAIYFPENDSMLRVPPSNQKEIYNKINLQEAGIEFVTFPLLSEYEFSDSQAYACYLILPNAKHPLFLPMGYKSQIDPLLTQADTPFPSALYRSRPGSSAPTLSPSALYPLVWTTTLDSILQANKIKTIWLSPDGDLHRIPFGALVDNNGKRLGEKYQINTVISTRILAERDSLAQMPKPQSAVLMGGMDYENKAELSAELIARRDSIASLPLWASGRGEREGLDTELPGTLTEVQGIDTTLQSAGIESKTFIGSTGSEEQLKAQSGNSPDILHIATHGFYFDTADTTAARLGEMQFKTASLPLFRSGLVFAGAKKALDDSEAKGYPGMEDGICTAFEISQLDLSQTELVVLSACQTGRGDIIGSEGVFGLQRAFKMAGVRYVMMTLWDVDDNATKAFMTSFYKHWINDGKGVRDAFHQTQQEFMKRSDRYSDPFFWAGFVLTE